MRPPAATRRVTVVALACLMAVAFEPAAIHLRLRSGDEGGEAVDAAVVVGLHRRLRLILRLRLAVLARLLLVPLIGLLLVARLLIGRLLNRHEARLRSEIRIAVVVIATGIIPRLALDPRLLLRLVLAKLFLGCGDQAKIMLGVLIIVFGSDGIA
jgi:hypothetical protein